MYSSGWLAWLAWGSTSGSSGPSELDCKARYNPGTCVKATWVWYNRVMDAVTRIEEVRLCAEEFLLTLKEPTGIEDLELVLSKLHVASAPVVGVNPPIPCYNGEEEDR